MLERRVNHKAIVLYGCRVAALVASLALVPRLGTEFLPELNEGAIWVNLMLPPGISLSEVDNTVRADTNFSAKIPGSASVIAQAGRPEDGTDPKPINMVELFVDLKPPESWRRKITKEELIEEMEQALEEMPGSSPLSRSRSATTCSKAFRRSTARSWSRCSARTPTFCATKIDDVLQQVSAVRGVARAFIDRAGKMPQLQIEIDRERAARYGLNVADIEDMIETAIGGKAATQIWEGEKKFGVVVRLQGGRTAEHRYAAQAC